MKNQICTWYIRSKIILNVTKTETFGITQLQHHNFHDRSERQDSEASRAVLTFAFLLTVQQNSHEKLHKFCEKGPTFKKMLILPHWHFSKNGGRRRRKTKKSNTTTIACLHFYFLWSNYSYIDGQKRWNFSRENLAKREFTSKSMFNYDVSSVSNIMQNWKGDGQRIIPAFYKPFIFQLLNKW